MNIRQKRIDAYKSQLPKSAVLVYIFLLDCLKTNEQSTIYIQRIKICKACHMQYNAADRALLELQNARFITKEKINEDTTPRLKITIL